MDATELKLAVSKWQKQIADTFRGPNGLVGERVRQIDLVELTIADGASTDLAGIMTLMDAFQDLIFQVAEECPPELIRSSGIKWTMLAATFQRFRFSLSGFYKGYYLDAAASLRAVFENVMYLGALLNGHINDWDIYPKIDPKTMNDDEIDALAEKTRRQLERKLRVNMFGSGSGLSKDDQEEIDRFLKLIHLHVHRTQSSIIYMFSDWHDKVAVPSFFPRRNLRHASVFGTTAVFVGWCYLRCLAGSLCGDHSSPQIRFKVKIMDDSFEAYVRLTQSSSAAATRNMVAQKFNFLTKVCNVDAVY